MKRIKDILSVLCLSAVMVACSSDDENGVPATDIINLSLQSNPGNNWLGTMNVRKERIPIDTSRYAIMIRQRKRRSKKR